MKHYGRDLAFKGEVITNGYDSDDFVINTKQRTKENTNIVTIVYTGTVWKATSLDVFCSVLERYLMQNPEMKQRIRVKVYGRVVGEENSYLETEILKEVIETYGYIEHEKVIEEMINADILLLTLSDLPGAEKIIHGKAFEYMASGKHIFALIPDGEVRKLISNNYGNATIVSPGDTNKVLSSLDLLVKNIDEIIVRNSKDVSGFLRENLTAKLSSIFERII